jgi:hypothetical protein
MPFESPNVPKFVQDVQPVAANTRRSKAPAGRLRPIYCGQEVRDALTQVIEDMYEMTHVKFTQSDAMKYLCHQYMKGKRCPATPTQTA